MFGFLIWAGAVVLYDIWQSLYQAYLLRNYTLQSAKLLSNTELTHEQIKKILGKLTYLVLGVALLIFAAAIFFFLGLGGASSTQRAFVYIATTTICIHPVFFFVILREMGRIIASLKAFANIQSQARASSVHTSDMKAASTAGSKTSTNGH